MDVGRGCVKGRDDVNRPVRRRSSAAAAGGPGCSRAAGSWKKLRRPRDLRQFRDEYSDLPPTDATQRCVAARSLDDTINTTLDQLRVIQDGDCCVVRCFNTTANGLVNHGDSFKRKNEPLLHTSSSDQDVVRAASRSRSQSSSNSHASYGQPVTDETEDLDVVEPAVVLPVTQSSSYTVLVLGQQGVGRTALLQQFLTSQFMAAETTLGIYHMYSLTTAQHCSALAQFVFSGCSCSC